MTKLHTLAKVADYTEAGYWGRPGWQQLLGRHAARKPDALAIADPLNLAAITGAEPRAMTWSELATYVDQMAGTIAAAGIGADDVVAVQLPNGIDIAAAYLAITRLGGVVTPFPVQFREHEMVSLCERAGVTAVVAADRIGEYAGAETARGLREKVAGLRTVLVSGRASGDAGALVDPAAEPVPAPADEGDGNDLLTICWTSGTEAQPKGVPRCANDWLPMALASVDAAELTGDDVLLNPFPMVNMAGIGGMFVPWLYTGAAMIQHHPFDPQTFFGQLAKHQVTYTVAPPALLMMVLARDDIPAQVFSSLRVIGSGSAPLSPVMTQGWKDKFGIEVINAFGSNEGACIAGDPKTVPDQQRRATVFPRFGSPDHEWPNRGSAGMRSRLVDPATDEEISEAGRVGELRISGPGVFAGYLGDDSGSAFDDEGYFRTGDLFEYAADDSGDLRYLRYVDRAKDVIVRGGQNISAAEVEGILSGHPQIAEAAVIGRPDDTMGERIHAVLVRAGDEEPTIDSIADYLKERGVAVYKTPESIEFVDALPRNAVGKILKRQLRDQAVS